MSGRLRKLPFDFVMEKTAPRLLIIAYTLASLRAHYDDVIVALDRAGVQVASATTASEG
jgi:hypothetical protein